MPSGVPSSEHLRADLGLRRNRDEPRELRQSERDRLIGRRPDFDFRIERIVSRQLGRDAVRACAQQEPVAEVQLEERARQADRGRGRLDVERDRFGGERKPGHGRQQRDCRRDSDGALADPAPGCTCVRRSAGLECDGRDGELRLAATTRELVEVRRRRIAGRHEPLDANRERLRGRAALEPSAIERDDVAVAHGASTRQRRAADAHVASAATGLDEEHAVEAADLDAAMHAVEHDIGVGTGAERDRQLVRSEFAPPTTVLDRYDRAASVHFRFRCHVSFPGARWVRRRLR